MTFKSNSIIFVFFMVISLICFTVSADRFSNILRPFSSDGCSRFPDGIPLFKPNLWLHCCIDHDVSYWQGGSSEQRSQADETLRKCVNQATDTKLGNDMWVGVRLGGFVGLPTSWHWGYGWVMDRGYEALDPDEKNQVDAWRSKIPAMYSKIAIGDSFLVRDRETITGNHCLDQAFMLIRSELKRDFNVTQLLKTKDFKYGYPSEKFEINVEGCNDPYQIEFQLLLDNACILKQNELLSRGRIRMREVHRPAINSCKL